MCVCVRHKETESEKTACVSVLVIFLCVCLSVVVWTHFSSKPSSYAHLGVLQRAGFKVLGVRLDQV